MKYFNKTRQILFGISAVSGVAAVYYFSNNRKVFTSYTTNYSVPIQAKWDDNWDHRSPDSLRHPRSITSGNLISNKTDDEKLNGLSEKCKSKAVRHLILVRHGQYNMNGKDDKQRFLTDLGKLQAEYTGKRLKEISFPYTEMVKSTMTRAQETGSIISQFLPDVPVTNCDLLREGAPIPPEPPIGKWRPELHFYQDGARIEAAFRRYFHRADPSQEKDSYTLLVCHANVIRYFVCRALQFPPEGWLRLSLNHASVTWISVTPSGRCILRAMGDSGHMPPAVMSS